MGATLLSPPAHPAWEQGAAPCSRRRITQRSTFPCNLSVTMAYLFFEPALIRRYSWRWITRTTHAHFVMSPRACLLGRTKCDCVCRVFCVFLYIRSYRAASNSLRRVSFVCRCVYRNAQAFNCGAPPLLFAVCAYLQLWVVGATLLSISALGNLSLTSCLSFLCGEWRRQQLPLRKSGTDS